MEITLNYIEAMKEGYLFTPCWGGSDNEVSEFLWFIDNERDLRKKWWHIKPGEVVFDIGCRFGSWTLPALAAGAIVFAIDPCRDSFFPLATQLCLNQIDVRCRHLPIMLGNENKIADFYAKENAGKGEGTPEKRMMFTFDVFAMPLPRLDWIKIDVEGAELEVLQGAKESLQKFSPRVIVEYHEQFGASIKAIQDYMRSLRYCQQEQEGVHGLWIKE